MTDELKRVLYLKDEPDIQKVAKLALETVGNLEVLICSSGAEAIGKAAAYAPDLLLLDVMMPGMDGPAVFLTAKVMPSEMEQFKEMGAIDVIAKPFDPMTLADQVRAAWDKR